MYNKTSLDTLCASLAKAMGIDVPALAAPSAPELDAYLTETLKGKKADRIFMYNPDAIAQWVYEKYPYLMREAIDRTDFVMPLTSVMPSVTPVCFGTMYTGAQPSVHGIQKYVKPVIAIDTLFDSLIRAGKKPVIISDTGSSLSKIYLERDMDYFIYDTLEEVNAKAAQLIQEDTYDFIVVYNANYDAVMHKFGTESVEALSELRANSQVFAQFSVLIERFWQKHNSLVGFAMDHGCHDIDGGCGSHGLDMEEDLNIVHLYKAYPAIG